MAMLKSLIGKKRKAKDNIWLDRGKNPVGQYIFLRFFKRDWLKKEWVIDKPLSSISDLAAWAILAESEKERW